MICTVVTVNGERHRFEHINEVCDSYVLTSNGEYKYIIYLYDWFAYAGSFEKNEVASIMLDNDEIGDDNNEKPI